jgi:hypothetical protein
MRSDLETVRSEIAAVNEDATRLFAGLTQEQLVWRPQSGRWSIAENLAHLNLTTQTTIPALEFALRGAREKRLRATGPYDLGVMGSLFVLYLEPPYRMKSKAPAAIRPCLQGPAPETLPQFLRSQELILKCMESAEGLDLARARFTSPFASVLRMSVIAAFCTATAHQRRHLWAAWQVRKQLPHQV